MKKEFRKVYGGLVDAQMRVRAGMQQEVEQMSEKLGMPTRSEVDSAHRKIAELERQLRRMRDAAQAQPEKPQASKPSAPGASPQVSEGSLKIAGDPLTGPRSGATKPKAAAAKVAPSKAAPNKSTAKKPTTKGKR